MLTCSCYYKFLKLHTSLPCIVYTRLSTHCFTLFTVTQHKEMYACLIRISIHIAAHYQMIQMQSLRRLLITTVLQAQAHAFVHCRMDLCRGWTTATHCLLELMMSILKCLQSVQNATGHVVSSTCCSDHITPVHVLLHCQSGSISSSRLRYWCEQVSTA